MGNTIRLPANDVLQQAIAPKKELRR